MPFVAKVVAPEAPNPATITALALAANVSGVSFIVTTGKLLAAQYLLAVPAALPPRYSKQEALLLAVAVEVAEMRSRPLREVSDCSKQVLPLAPTPRTLLTPNSP